MGATITLALRGAGGEPVDLWRTMQSHGVASLPPHAIDEQTQTLTTTVSLPRGKPRTVRVSAGKRGSAVIEVAGPVPSESDKRSIADAVRHILALDRDLSEFYEALDGDADLAWARAGAGRMIRSQTVFEEVVKTVCTTNCAWGATVRMVTALVEHLGQKAPGAPAEGWQGRAFPTPAAMAEAPESFYRDVVRAGYRGPYFRALAAGVAAGALDLEGLASSDLSDDALFKEFLALPGVGPYAASHIMMMIGRHSRLILDSWTRPTFARLVGKKTVGDAQIERRFKRYGEHAGLAFWLYLTKDWVVD